eukprot:945192-Rhodomonas_salina.1
MSLSHGEIDICTSATTRVALSDRLNQDALSRAGAALESACSRRTTEGGAGCRQSEQHQATVTVKYSGISITAVTGP